MTSSSEDQQHKALLLRVVSRDKDSQQALDTLYKLLYPQVYAFIRQILNSSDEADIDGIVVETMYEVWTNAAKFEGKSKVTTWVLGIARFRALNFVRANKKQQQLSSIEDYESELQTHEDATETLYKEQKQVWLEKCMSNLSHPQRVAVHMLLVENASMQEIADAQSSPLGTVKTRIHYAKAALKKCLAQYL